MTSACTEGGLQEEDQQGPALASNTNGFEDNANNTLEISTTSKERILGDESLQGGKYTIASRIKLQQLLPSSSLASPSAKFRQISEERDELLHSVPSSTSQFLQKPFNKILAKKIDWESIWKVFKNWIKSPLNMVLFLWICCVAVSGAILFLVMTGMLNEVLTKKSQRDSWFEVNNQILNALFTLMCLYQHPRRFHHLILLCRWNSKDISTLRKIYCKNGTYKPHERVHMMVVVVLLHVNCFAQYALCCLNLGYKRCERPAVGVGISLSIAIAAPALAGMYTIFSPLGKEYEADEESQNQIPVTDGNSNMANRRRVSLEKRFSFASRNDQSSVENTPQWKGGLFDIWENFYVAYLSVFCTFCVFGWNMERLGFGNMYVHIATFLLFCMAPFWIFNLAAINIDDENVRRALGLTGILLCLFGLLYGGFWRIQIRKRFKLPENNLCCGKPAVADCAQWLFCCWCSLAQEVRTAESYGIVDEKIFRRKQSDGCVFQPAMNSLPREDKSAELRSVFSSSKIWSESSPSPSRESKDHYSPNRQVPERKQEVMEAPIPLTIHIEARAAKEHEEKNCYQHMRSG